MIPSHKQDVEQQISIDDSDKKPHAMTATTTTTNEDKLTSGEEATPDAFGVEIVHELYRLCLQTKPDRDGLTDPPQSGSLYEVICYPAANLSNRELVPSALADWLLFIKFVVMTHPSTLLNSSSHVSIWIF